MLHFVMGGISEARHLGFHIGLAHMESEMTIAVEHRQGCRLPREVARGYSRIYHKLYLFFFFFLNL